jgi:hypothetical protein
MLEKESDWILHQVIIESGRIDRNPTSQNPLVRDQVVGIIGS